MRALSPHTRLSVGVFPPKERREQDGLGGSYILVDTPAVSADFQHGALFPEEQRLVLEKFTFTNLPLGVNPLSVIGVWDSEVAAHSNGWDDDFHDKVCDRLRQLEVNDSHFVIVEEKQAAKPWGSYDEDTTDEIVEFAIRFKSVDEAIAYERQQLGRVEIIAALELSKAPEGAGAQGEDVVVSAR